MNFDMHRIGQTIARLRREHSMTQMALADAMGVSFQAVSNWERGQTMPDISKLPELAELFGTTIDALLGRHAPLIEKAVEGKLDELPALSVAEVAEVAPLLPPSQLDDLTDRLMDMPKLPDMTELLPFLPTDKVNEMFRRKAAEGCKGLSDYAVFASTADVDEVALGILQAEECVDELLPFMSQKAVDDLAHVRESSGKSTDFLLPFMSQKAIDDLARTRESSGQGTDSLLPFMSYAALNDITLARLKEGKNIGALLPFLNQDMLQKLFSAASSKD